MRVDDDDVRRWAQLARIDVPEDEVAALRADLESVLAHLETVRTVDVDGLEPLLRPGDPVGGLRDDDLQPGTSRERALPMGRGEQDGFFVVPRTASDGSGSA